MISYNTEYFGNNCYFYLRDRGDKISLYYSVGETLNESRKNDEREDFDKSNSKNVKAIIQKVLHSKKKLSKERLSQIKKIRRT
jgi:hypothetical protein